MDRNFIIGIVKDWGLATVIVVAVLIGWRFMSPQPLSNGSAPDFQVVDGSGQMVSLADMEEDLIVLNFWATWCGPCRSEIPELNEFHDQHPEVGLYGISVDTQIGRSRLFALSKKYGIEYQVLHDATEQAGNDYGVNGIPTTFILDKKRNIRRVVSGPVSSKRLTSLVEKFGG